MTHQRLRIRTGCLNSAWSVPNRVQPAGKEKYASWSYYDSIVFESYKKCTHHMQPLSPLATALNLDHLESGTPSGCKESTVVAMLGGRSGRHRSEVEGHVGYGLRPEKECRVWGRHQTARGQLRFDGRRVEDQSTSHMWAFVSNASSSKR